MTAADVVTVERVIPAQAADIFALLADATRHRDFDGSGAVQGARGTPAPLTLGKFVAGRIWRYRLEPVAGGTSVSESWDISRESRLTKPIIRGQGSARAADMAATLERIERIVTAV